MKYTLMYKNSQVKTHVGFIELNKESYNLKLIIFRSCPRYRKILENFFYKILQILAEDYTVEDIGFDNHRLKGSSKGIRKRNIIKKREKLTEDLRNGTFNYKR